VSKADYPYPDDEFDAAAGHDVPRGVHREPRSGWSRWWPFVVVIVVAPLLAYGAVTLVTHQNGSSSGNQAAVDDGTGANDGSSPTETATAPAVAPTTSPTNVPTQTQTAAAQLGTPVVILNAAKIQGLAGRAATKLQGAGFTAVTTGNSTGTAPSASTVYYTKADLQATAAKAAQALKITTVTLDPTKGGKGITVVLTTDTGL
jgi:hypothetical protein